jgi:hypothetical protein
MLRGFHRPNPRERQRERKRNHARKTALKARNSADLNRGSEPEEKRANRRNVTPISLEPEENAETPPEERWQGIMHQE